MIEPITVKSSDKAVEAERIPVFVIEHADKENETYTVPKEIGGGTAMRALDVLITNGEEAAILWLARHALGPEGMRALLDSPQLTFEQAQDLLGRIGKHYIGVVRQLGKE